MDRDERVREVQNQLEDGQGCSAARLLYDLLPAERLSVIKQVIDNNKTAGGSQILDLSDPTMSAPRSADSPLVWVSKQPTDKSKPPVRLIGFNDLTMLPCKNTHAAAWW